MEPGLRIEQGAVTKAGGQACALADELDSVRRSWHQLVGGNGAAVGYADLSAAAERVATAWDAEFGVQVEVLRELCRGVAGAVTAYGTSDANAAARTVGPR